MTSVLSRGVRASRSSVVIGARKTCSAFLIKRFIDVSSSKLTPYQLCQEVKKAGIKFDQIIHEFGRWMHISFAPEMRQQELTIFKPEGKYKAGILTEAEYHKA